MKMAALEKMEAKEALRNIISGLWFAILYRSVERHTGYDKAVRKASRCRAICNLTACLRAGKEGLDDLQSALEDDDLHRSTNRYRTVIRRVLIFIDKTLKTTESLYRYLKNALRDVIDLVDDDDVDDAATSLLSQHLRRQDQLINTDTHTGLESSYNSYSISLEATFNKSTHPQYTVQYDSPILIYVQSGDINATRALLQAGMASIYDVDPYNLGLLYYASYYCWRCYGAIKAIQMCRMLIQTGADMNMMGEIGKLDIPTLDGSMWLLISCISTPLHTMADSAVVERCRDLNSPAVIEVALLCNMSSHELVEEHRTGYSLTTLHETLLGINLENSSLQEHPQSLQSLGSLSEPIDKPDSRGRSALAWAVEYGMADAVRILLRFGADACQYRISHWSQLPMLHLVIAGPPPPLASGFLEVVKILLATDIDINARDDEAWSAWHVAASWRSYNVPT
ncbi:hypothetical protein VC83_00155 [Pseudogymnoascus destructans]|uniref:Uncharacterized protein n=2 Tax=Pseudogymnoascus destructans TaxID=655981 RepID=L8FSM9_PSED2|nr:uncharacterized protein VC83_00155 [Pseudogymnoascus destructans]ELR03483.1 hypothetical protein GMDG_06213 [Pseudogymnoascus destructans 20631-21]OAF63365.2 hypothetical protein VC83_00155 [Pseudogymnoascus destructans]